MLLTPAGLSPGESFRFAFVTDGTRDATSTNIADYNTFVNTQAGGATYDGSVVTWAAIASTPTVNAIDNVGPSLAPVYLSDGTIVATSTTTASGGLWDGGSHPIDRDLAGQFIQANVWTGTLSDGTGAPNQQLGQHGIGGGPVHGLSIPTSPGGWVNAGIGAFDQPLNLYGISSELTVPGSAVPEPASLWLLGTAISAGLAYGWSRRRRA